MPIFWVAVPSSSSLLSPLYYFSPYLLDFLPWPLAHVIGVESQTQMDRQTD